MFMQILIKCGRRDDYTRKKVTSNFFRRILRKHVFGNPPYSNHPYLSKFVVTTYTLVVAERTITKAPVNQCSF